MRLLVAMAIVLVASPSGTSNVVEELLNRQVRQAKNPPEEYKYVTMDDFYKSWADSDRTYLSYDQYLYYYSCGYGYYGEGFYNQPYKPDANYPTYNPPYTYEYGYGYGGGHHGGGGTDGYDTWGPQCDRKEYRLLSNFERQRLHNAINAAKDHIIPGPPPLSQYDIFVAMHSAPDSPGAHRGAGFYTWHREFLMRFEQMLRQYEPDLCLPYWDSTIDSHLTFPKDSAIWTDNYLGNNIGPVVSGPFQGWNVMPGCEYGTDSALKRYTGFSGKCFLEADIDYLLARNWYLQITCQTDCYFEYQHGEVHVFVNGQMSMAACAPSDPVFFLHHAFVDCTWQTFREESQDSPVELEYPTEGAGSGLNIGGPDHEPFDRMEPWVELYNIHGLSDHYTNYYYQCSPRPSCKEGTCTSPVLWCNGDVCTAKVRLEGYCGDFPDHACYGKCLYGWKPVCNSYGYCSCGKGTYKEDEIDYIPPSHYDEYISREMKPDVLYPEFRDSYYEAEVKYAPDYMRNSDNYSYFYSTGQTYVINQEHEYKDQCYAYDMYRDYKRAEYEYGYYYQPGGGTGNPGNTFYTWLPRCQRKEYRQLSATERNRLHNAFNAMKATGEYDVFVALHRSGSAPGAHGGQAFLPWHREYLTRLEMALRMHDPDVCLPFWDSTLDSHLPTPADSAIWTASYAGNNQGQVVTGPFASWTTNPGCPYSGIGNQLGRSTGHTGRCMLQSDITDVMSKEYFQQLGCGTYGCDLESSHGAVHMFVGGQMSDSPCAPSDPIFFMHHAFIDCIWQKFREDHQSSPIEHEYPTGNGPGAPWIGGADHEPFARMHPFSHLYNIHGISDHYTNYYYECASWPRECCSHDNCGSDILFCHDGLCKAKVAYGGDCKGLGDDSCQCPRRQNPKCIHNVKTDTYTCTCV